ncbi:MAG: IS3 family transposase [Bacteriovoracaceae bacterium]
MCHTKRFSKKNGASLESRRQVAHEYISRQFTKNKVLSFTGLARSTFYYQPKQGEKQRRGRPIPGYSINKNGTLTPDKWIVEEIKKYRANLNFQNGIGCKSLHEYLELDYQITVNHKKIYRLCQENNLLLAKKKKIKRIKSLANNLKITAPNQLWQFDIKYGYIHGENRAFYFLAFIDVFTKEIMGYHIGTSCTALDLKLTLKTALNELSNEDIDQLVIRSDNGPQMSSNQFKAYVDAMDITHEFTPIRCPNKNAYIESFFSIFETEFLQVRYFTNLKDVHTQVNDWIVWYNQKRLHGSLKYKSPQMFTKLYYAGLNYQYEVSA